MGRQNKLYQKLNNQDNQANNNLSNLVEEAEIKLQNKICKYFLLLARAIELQYGSKNQNGYITKLNQCYQHYSIQAVQEISQIKTNKYLNDINQITQGLSQLTQPYDFSSQGNLSYQSDFSVDTIEYFQNQNQNGNLFDEINQRLISIKAALDNTAQTIQNENQTSIQNGLAYVGNTPSFNIAVKTLKEVEKLLIKLPKLNYSEISFIKQPNMTEEQTQFGYYNNQDQITRISN
ncbi:hypothetical protein ABPG72_010513 [Tetrahymena utriculariae]